MDFKSIQGASSSSSSPSSHLWTYDVFVSFRGEDTRKKFTDHLFNALDQKGIFSFRDDQTLERGKPISPELIKAIEESRFAIIVFSRNYASSSWCLDELVKIVECMKVMGQTVLPIFYDVDPSEVRKQVGSYERAFTEYEETVGGDMEKVKKWRAALTEVANLSGWALQDRHESALIQQIVKELMSKLSDSMSSFAKDLVGIDSRLQEMDLCLGMGSDDVRIMGICGMGGIGKTTLARIIYDRVFDQFKARGFVANVREVSENHGIARLQEQLLSQILVEKSINVWDVHRGINIIRSRLRNKRVFIVLDDVDNLEQLETLAGKHEWFGVGSRVIITTRDEHLLKAHGVDEIYKAKGLNGEEALQLLSWKAFKQNHPAEDYMELSKQIVSHAGGLPLALEVLGSFLYGRSVNEWRSAIKRLKETPNRQVFDVLKISYDGLEETEKSIFLDIACFFKWENFDRVTEILDGCDFYPDIGIRVLLEKSLITIDNNKLWMHDLLQEMGQAIVRQESPKEPGKRSRLWLYNDICHVLTKLTGTEAVECIYLNPSNSKEIPVDPEAFSKMNNLRLLSIHDVHPSEGFDQHSKGLDFLSNELRILKWHGCPLKYMPTSFKPEKLLELEMSHSCIVQLWEGTMQSNMLKLINLSHSLNLIRTPDLRGVPNLERLILEGCKNLYEVHPSIGELKKLILLNLKDCRNLRSLPSSISSVKSLKFLHIYGCTKLDKLPENLGDLELLEELDVGQTAIVHSPSSIVLLKNLKRLSFHGCKGQPPNPWNLLLRCLLPGIGPSSMGLLLPTSLSGLWSLTQLDLSDCNLSEGAIPSDLGHLSALKKLNLSRNNFVTLPSSIIQLSQLQSLKLEYCQKLQAVPELPSSIEDLSTYSCSSLKTLSGPSDLSMAQSRDFWLTNCFKLAENQGNNNVALEMLNSHLLSLLKFRVQLFLSNVPNLIDNQWRNNVVLTVLMRYILSKIKIMLQGQTNPPSHFPKLIIYLSGSGIPDWFIHQSTASSLIIDLPPYWYNDYKFMGLAICAVFEVHDPAAIIQDDHSSGRIHKFIFNLLSEQENYIIFGTQRNFSINTFALSDHLWLLYVPFDEYLQKQNWRNVKAYFRTEGPGFMFKRSAIRLVYLQDVIDLNPTIFGGLNLSVVENLGTQLRNLAISASQSQAVRQRCLPQQ